MRPHSLVGASVGFALTGINYKNIVDISVIVVVVAAVIYVVFQLFDSLDCHLFGVDVVAIRIIGAIVAAFARKGHRA